MSYSGKRVLITGGLGFIGSNLALTLLDLGARVSVVDSSVPGCGANPLNLDPHGAHVEVIACDLGQPGQFASAIRGADVIFNLAGEISHIHSMRFPERDLELNATAQLRFYEACTRWAAGCRIVYAGTRQVYGIPKYLPVDERHPVEPIDYNGIHKYAATQYLQLLTRLGRLDGIVLRLTNIYGPRQAIHLTCQGVLATFLRKALGKERIVLFGDGRQVRDPLYVSDVCDSMLLAGLVADPPERTFNIGFGKPVSLRETAEALTAIAGLPPVECRPFPPERKEIDIGDYFSDIGAAARVLDWRPATSMREGLARSLEFFDERRAVYLPGSAGCPVCQA